ncbi:MAG: hypothetical protein DRP66_06660, partial [Planctomycetota bacterium]
MLIVHAVFTVAVPPQPERPGKFGEKHLEGKGLDRNEAGSAEAQPIRLRSEQALPGIAGSRRRIVVGVAVIHLLPRFLIWNNSESCNALENLIKQPRRRRIQYLPKAE